MRKLFPILMLVMMAFVSNADIVYVTDLESEADLVVYITESEYLADRIVTISEKYQAEENTNSWYFTESKLEATLIIFYTTIDYNATKIYFSETTRIENIKDHGNSAILNRTNTGNVSINPGKYLLNTNYWNINITKSNKRADFG